MTTALLKCLGMNDAEVIGCVANLATVRHEYLNRLLSTLYRGVMQLLIVESGDSRNRVAAHLLDGVCLWAILASQTPTWLHNQVLGCARHPNADPSVLHAYRLTLSAAVQRSQSKRFVSAQNVRLASYTIL